MDRFGPGYNATLIVTADIVSSDDPQSVMAGLKHDIEATEGVDHVAISTPNQNADLGFVQVIPTTASDDPTTAELVQRLQDSHDAWADTYGVDTTVTGLTAVQIDVSQRLTSALIPFGVFVVVLCFILLMMVFRSVWVPVKATLGYLLSVGAAFGATRLVFNEGVGGAIVNLEKPVAIISFMPIVIMGILFGLAMDYEVFLVSRIREEYLHGLRNHPERAPREVARQAIHAEGVRAAALFVPLDVHVDPGQVAVLVGDPQARSAAMLVLAGRMQVTHGIARVATRLLPEESGKVRRATGFVEVTDNPAVAEDLDTQLRHAPAVVFVDGADGITSPEERAALDRLIVAARTQRRFAVVLGVTEQASRVAHGAEVFVTVHAPRHTPSLDPDHQVAVH